MTRPVVVAGGGPVGLTTALGLHHYGLPVVVLEEDLELSKDTKAGTTLSRTIEVFDRYGVAEQVLARSLRIDEIGDLDRETGESLHSVKTWLLERETRHPYVVNLPQHYMEPILAEALAERQPGALRMGHRVSGFHQEPDHVVVELETPQGTERMEAAYLLACDGGRSTIRKLLGAEVEGTTFPERYTLVDVAVDLDVENPRDYPYLAYFAHPEEWMILVRQPQFWRFLWPRPPDRPEPTREELADKARQYIGDVDRMEVVGSYEYTVHARAATRWREGRVFLMGDAAHLITPMWALGLNTGILDASNLPWRIAWVERGWADPALLDGYEREQAPLARFGSGAMAEAARRYMARLSESLEAMTEYDFANAVNRTMLGVKVDVEGKGEWSLTLTEPQPPPVRLGDRIPDMTVRTGEGGVTTLHELVRHRFAALYLTDVRRRPAIPDSTPALGHWVLSRWDAPLDSGLRDRALLDVGSMVERRLGLPAGSAILVRPDGHVAGVEPFAEGVAEKLYQRVTGRPSNG